MLNLTGVICAIAMLPIDFIKNMQVATGIGIEDMGLPSRRTK
jgi:hypothetical protein